MNKELTFDEKWELYLEMRKEAAKAANDAAGAREEARMLNIREQHADSALQRALEALYE